MGHIKADALEAIEVEPGLYGVRLIDGGQGAQNVSLVRGWMRPGARHSPHTHGVEEAVVFLSGRGVVEVAGRRHNVGPGDVVHIPPNVVHSTLNTGGEDLCFVASFAGNLIASNPLQTSDAACGTGKRFAAPVRHWLAWMMRRAAVRLSRGA